MTTIIRHLARIIVSVVLVLAPAGAQQATAVPFGFGCGPYNDPFGTMLAYNGVPRIGSTVGVAFRAPRFINVIRVFGGNPMLFVGTSRTAWGPYPLPMWAFGNPFGFPASSGSCVIWTPFEFLVGVRGTPLWDGWSELRHQIPNSLHLVGARLYHQMVFTAVVVTSTDIYDVAYYSNGGEMTIGL
jgi:hypothetical protein